MRCENCGKPITRQQAENGDGLCKMCDGGSIVADGMFRALAPLTDAGLSSILSNARDARRRSLC